MIGIFNNREIQQVWKNWCDKTLHDSFYLIQSTQEDAMRKYCWMYGTSENFVDYEYIHTPNLNEDSNVS